MQMNSRTASTINTFIARKSFAVAVRVAGCRVLPVPRFSSHLDKKVLDSTIANDAYRSVKNCRNKGWI